jgi:hypothetical protein
MSRYSATRLAGNRSSETSSQCVSDSLVASGSSRRGKPLASDAMTASDSLETGPEPSSSAEEKLEAARREFRVVADATRLGCTMRRRAPSRESHTSGFPSVVFGGASSAGASPQCSNAWRNPTLARAAARRDWQKAPWNGSCALVCALDEDDCCIASVVASASARGGRAEDVIDGPLCDELMASAAKGAFEFRPCIDLHGGRVKQIVGSTLTSDGAETNFETDRSPAEFAECVSRIVSGILGSVTSIRRYYQSVGLRGGHVIMLGPGNEEAALSALRAFPGGLQVGGGITDENCRKFLDAGASHVIVTRWVLIANGCSVASELRAQLRIRGWDSERGEARGPERGCRRR